MIQPNTWIGKNGHLIFGGVDAVEMAQQYGTPLYLADEQRLRFNCRTYVQALRECFPQSLPLYAGKALACKYVYRVVAEEGMGIDAVSAGELYLAQQAGFPMDKVYFHGNSKPTDEIAYAVSCGVGFFVVDNLEELETLDAIAQNAGVRQKVLLRLTPGIDTHTFAAVRTGQVDSKFGAAIETGQAMEFLRLALEKANLEVLGYHCHIGSQVFESRPFVDAADIMLRFAAKARKQLGYTPEMLNLGGGYGVRYVETDPVLDIAESIREVSEAVHTQCAELELPLPMILMEPGRSIVADTMMTLYTINAVKQIPGFKNYVAIDGGMTDNPRFALYHANYTTLLANKASRPADFRADIAGRCCESGDLIQDGAAMQTPQRGDTLAVFITGAYNYSMASNYNCVPRAPIVFLNKGQDTLAVRRETFEDLACRDV